jgi:alpha-tubulin suppressor-like RCC1 family protein
MKQKPFKIIALTFILVASTLACSLFSPQKNEEQEETTSETQAPAETTPDAIKTEEVLPSPGANQSEVKIVFISANSNRNLAIDSQGNTYEWGTYTVGPVNSPCKGGDACKLSPSLVPGLSGAVAVSTGYDHNLALKGDGTVWGWGQNETYQLGLGDSDTEYHTQPIQVPGLADVIAISAGANFNLALKKDGTVWAWGDNGSGQLGDGKDSYTPDYPLHEASPFQVVNLSGVIAIDTGWHHSIALRNDGTVWTWGFNQFGELGLSTADTEQHPVPAQVPGLAGVTAIGAGFSNNLVREGDGSVWVWGANLGAQLGTGAMDPQPHATPILIESFANAVMLDSGSMQIMALLPDGNVWTIGVLETGFQAISPAAVAGLPKIAAISAGEDHDLALGQDGSLWAWGHNSVGQLGDGTMNHRNSPGMVIFP